jgi:DNA polymerase-3 subunit delta'
MSWQRVRGHQTVVELFRQALKRGRLAHAYLFVGSPGVGKRLFAGELAKALLCEGAAPEALQACDHCPACVQVEAGTHPDFFAVSRPEESLEVPIDAIRELCRTFSLRSARGHGKVALLDDADDLNDAAANCFLKTLEEPPPRSVLILIGSGAERQLPTIVSRCQVVRFAPLPDAEMTAFLRDQGITDAAMVERLVRLGEGSPGQAQALADPALWEFRRTLLAGLLDPRSDGVALARTWGEFVEEAGKESGAQRRRAALALRLLVDFLKDALRLSVGGPPVLGEERDRMQLEETANRLRTERLLELLDRCLHADVQIDRRVQLVLVLEALVDAFK